MVSGRHHRQRVLVTGARLPAALEIIKALRAEGAEVWAADSLFITPAGVSRHVAGYLRFPSPAFFFSEFREFLIETVKRLGIELIIPVSEEIFFLAKMADELSPAAVFSPPLRELRALHSKWEILNMAKDCGLRIPHTIRVTTHAELRAAYEKMPDGILKPEFSRGAHETCFFPHECPTSADISETRPWVVQERLEGREISTYCVAVEGRVLVQTAYEPLYRVGHGASLYFRPVRSTMAQVSIENLVRKYSLTGQFSFDLMEECNGSIALIECNPRASSGVHLIPDDSRWGGAFFGNAVSRNDRRGQASAAKLAVMFINLLPALRGHRLCLLFSDLRDARDSTFALSDPLPSLCAPLSALEILWRSRSWSVSGARAFTYDLEWNG